MTDPKRTSLDALYRQRRDRHPVPDALQDKLRKRLATRQRRKSRWLTLGPAAASLALVVVILHPYQNRQPETVLPEIQAVNMSPSMPAPSADVARLQSKTADSADRLDDGMAFSAESIMADEVSERAMSTEPEVREERVTELTAAQATHGIALQILQSDTGLAATCGGSLVRAPALQGQTERQWFELKWDNEAWQITPIDQTSCLESGSD